MSGVSEKVHVCPTCGNRFVTPRALSAHRRAHQPKAVCVVCGQQVRRLADHWRRRHLDQAHTLLPVLEAQEEQLAIARQTIEDLGAQLARGRF